MTYREDLIRHLGNAVHVFDVLHSRSPRQVIDTHMQKIAQHVIDTHMQKISHRVMDVFEKASEDTLADEIMTDVFAAIGLTEAFGAISESGETE